MTELRTLQKRFLSYLRDGDGAITADVTGGTADANARRLSIYFNAYRMRLRGVIDSDHPVLGHYLGDELFDRMVREYIDSHPSSRTSLRYFGDELPSFLERTPPFSRLPVVGNIAAFERLLMDVFDAAGAPRLHTGVLSTFAPQQWPALVFRFHASVRCFVTRWNTVEIWRSIKARREPPDAVRTGSQAWLVWRNRERLTEFRSMSADEYEVITHAMNGDRFADLCEMLLAFHPQSQVAERALAILSRWLDQGLLVDASPQPPVPV